MKPFVPSTGSRTHTRSAVPSNVPEARERDVERERMTKGNVVRTAGKERSTFVHSMVEELVSPGDVRGSSKGIQHTFSDGLGDVTRHDTERYKVGWCEVIERLELSGVDECH
jgi:hypothetical protein